jgi:hypothetical protein
MIDLLRRDVMNRCTSRYGHDVSGFGRGVAANVSGRGIFDALFRVGILGLAGCGPVCFF